MLAHVSIPDYYLRIARCEEQSTVVVVDRQQLPALVLACGPAAASRGIQVGMSEAEAFALATDAHFVAYEPHAANEFLAELLDSLDGFSPDIELLGPGHFLLDLGQLSDEAAEKEGHALMEACKAQVGLASNRFAASLAACEPGVHLVAPGQEEAFSAPFSISCLPVRREVLRRLELLGIRRLDELRRLPTKQLTTQFAALGKQLADWARGLDPTPMRARPLQKLFATERCLDDCSDAAYLLSEAQTALEELFAELKLDYKLATRIQLLFELADGQRQPLELRFASPVDDAQRALKLLAGRLETLQVEQPIRALHVHLDGLVTGYAQQMSLLPLTLDEQRQQGVQRVVQRLQAKAQKGALMQVTWQDADSRIPERRAYLQDLVHATHRRPLLMPKPARVATGAGALPAVVQMRAGWVAVEWIMEAWELDEEWWTAQPLLRSYYRVRLSDGSLLRLFRDAHDGRWYRQSI